MSKALYAFGFMAMCCVILVIHENTAREQTKLNDDPFLASVEARVVAVAQHRLKSRLAEDAAQRHISEARKAIKASLMDADADNQLHIEKYHAEQQLLAAEEAPKPAAPATAAAPAAAPSTKKQFTWAELNAGDDAEEEQAKISKKDTHNLMKGLLAAPKVDADEAESGGATMVTTEFSDDETQEQESPKAKIAKITDAADSAAEQEEQEEAPPAQEEVEIKAPAQKEEEVETEVKEAPKKAAKAAPKVEKKAVAQKVAAKVAKTAKKVEAAAKPAPKEATKEATKEAADKVKAAPVPESQEVEEEEPIVADGYKEDDEYANYDKDDDW